MSELFDYETDDEMLEEQDSGVWLSVGDLMSSLVMIFALLFITVLVQLNEYRQAFQELPRIIQEAIKDKIKGGEIKVDPETGDISLSNEILFDENSAVLKPQGKIFYNNLSQFIVKLFFQILNSLNLINKLLVSLLKDIRVLKDLKKRM